MPEMKFKMRNMMPRGAVIALLLASLAAARPASNALIRQRTLAFLQRVYAWQGIHQISIVSLSPPQAGMRQMTVRFSRGKQSLTRIYWVTEDGRHILNGQRFSLAPGGALRDRILAYCHKAFPAYTAEIQKYGPPDSSGVRAVTVKFTKGEQSGTQHFWVMSHANWLMNGENDRLSADPWASVRRKLQLRGAPSIGPSNAPVSIVEFSDLECPYCREENQVLNELRARMPKQVRLVFKFYPLVNIHPWAMQAALAGTCVARQKLDHFWPFEQAVFDAQPKLDAMPAQAVASRLQDFALESGTTPAAYKACLNSPATRAVVEASIRNGKLVGVKSTPTLFINGQRIPGAVPLKDLQPLVAWLAKQPGATPSGRLALRRRLRGKQCGLCKPLPPLPHPPPPTPHS